MRPPIRLGLIIPSFVLAATFAPAAAADYSATSGPVTATLSQPGGAGGLLALNISRDGTNYVDDTVNTAVCGKVSYCQPAADPYGSPVVAIRQATGLAEPDIFVHLTNGGNICCRVTLIYHYDAASNSYSRSVHTWSDAVDQGPLKSLGKPRQVFFVSSDGRFRYAFGCGACTPGPVQIWQDRLGRLVDVTRRFRRLISQDARRWLRLYLNQRTAAYGADGLLVAYVADEALLGRSGQGFSFAAQQGREGYTTEPGSGFSSSQQFLTRLRDFLRKLGYLSRG
jgi:hypothetical protein